MLFLEEALHSYYDFEHVLPDELASLSSLSDELYQMTQILYGFEKKKVIACARKDQNQERIVVPFQDIPQTTWYRSKQEIKELLYRSKRYGTYQTQFSINKGLGMLGIEEPDDYKEYKDYLKLLYFFYVLNYFIFPKKNIYKLLKKDHRNYQNSFDEGTFHGRVVTLIIENLLTDSNVLDAFLVQQQAVDQGLEQLSMIIETMPEKVYDHHEEILNRMDEVTQVCLQYESKEGILIQLFQYLEQYAMYSYADDLLCNLTSHPQLFYYEPLTMKPPETWKRLYVPVAEIDDFLYRDEVVSFCKQSSKKVEVRDKMKFMESKSVLFFKQLLAYDWQWIKQFHEEKEGLFIQLDEDGNGFIYALKIAVLIQTYHRLTNVLKVRIESGHHTSIQPLKTTLSIHDQHPSLFPATLVIRYFLLAAHAQYLNCIRDGEYYGEFQMFYLYPEIINMEIFKAAFDLPSLHHTILFLNLMAEELIDISNR